MRSAEELKGKNYDNATEVNGYKIGDTVLCGWGEGVIVKFLYRDEQWYSGDCRKQVQIKTEKHGMVITFLSDLRNTAIHPPTFKSNTMTQAPVKSKHESEVCWLMNKLWELSWKGFSEDEVERAIAIRDKYPETPAASPVSDAVDMELVKGCVKRLSDLKKYHINPYNLGEQGEVGSLITTLAQLFKLPPPSSPTHTNVQEQDNIAYNKAISDAIWVLRRELYEDANEATNNWNKHHMDIISKLYKLKKPSQSPNQ